MKLRVLFFLLLDYIVKSLQEAYIIFKNLYSYIYLYIYVSIYLSIHPSSILPS